MSFGGMSMKDMNKMLKQVQRLQADMAKLQEELKERVVEATAGGGAVRVEVTGGQELRSITLRPEVVDPEDIEMLQDLIVAAVNEGLRRSQELVREEMMRLTGGLGLPGLP
jgi:DNA-binding YbaB/EbfC family protein